MSRSIRAGVALALGLLALAVPPARAAEPQTFAAATAGLRKLDGLAGVYVDQAGGRVLLQLPPPDADGLSGRWIYQVYLRSGLGSTPVGLDRSAPGPNQILAFRRFGKRVFAQYENTAFRADAGGAAERAAVRESFPPSTVWAGDVVAEAPDGGVLIDITGYLDRDAFGVVDALKAAKEGGFHLEDGLSHVDPQAVAAFPDNLEFEASETFAADDPGSEVKGISPDPHRFTLVEHHSLVRLPPPGYRPRWADPRLNLFDTVVTDYSAPLGAPLVRHLALRFRLEKTDPTAARSPVVKPIVFWVDPAAPEPVRQALVDGARAWAEAFDAAGFIDAFQVKVLPDGVSPLDARYNVINWVHRQTRGWSYGQPVIDPRTGEIIKGSVLLGSQRVRQDRIIFEGLVGADKTGTGGPDDPIQVALSRLRQLSAHETGHALGFAHNFAGSTFGDRASVDDYPGPRVTIGADGRLGLGDAYRNGLGEWDLFAVDWLYSQTPPGGDEAGRLDALAASGYARGLRFVSDDDSRPPDGANPYGALWDDGPDAIAGLAHALEVRRLALSRFGLANLPDGAAAADLRRAIVPIYLFHRYEAEAAAKLIGGVDFTYAIKGDGHEAARPVAGEAQRRALAGLLAAVEPHALDLPDPLIALLSDGHSDTRDPQFETEVFGDTATPVFDLADAADTAADLVFSAILQPRRLNRVADMAARDATLPGLGEVLSTTVGAVFAPAAGGDHAAEIRRRVRARLIADLARTLADPRLSPSAAPVVRAALVDLGARLAHETSGDAADHAQYAYYAARLGGLDKGAVEALAAAAAPRLPPGMPIGGGEDDWFGDAPAGVGGR